MPTALQILRGRPGRRPLAGQTPEVPAAAPEPPEWLTEAARREWDRLIPELVKAQVVTLLDQAIVSLYCTALVRSRELDGLVTHEGFVITRGAGPGVHPCFKASLEVLAQLRLIGGEIGLSPSARARLRLPA